MLKLISKFALLILVLGVLYLLISGSFFSLSPFVIAGQVLALALSVWARRSFQSGQFSIHAEPSHGPLLVSGPYKFIRHPMYAAALLLIWSSILGHLSPVTVSIGCIVTGVIAVRIMTEDQILRENFPEYAEYAHSTRRIIPLVTNCLKENLSEGQKTKGKDLNEQTGKAGTVGSAATAVCEGQ